MAYHFVPTVNSADKEPAFYDAALYWNNTGDWQTVQGDVVKVQEGTYTCSVNATWVDGDPLLGST